jgi:hypothetical protein
VRWHGRLKTEAPLLTLAEWQLALAALASLCAGERGSIELLGAAGTSSASVRARRRFTRLNRDGPLGLFALAAAVLDAWWSRRPGGAAGVH